MNRPAENAAVTVVITGASGVVGARVLHHLLARPGISRVTALGRRPLAQKHGRLVSTVVDLKDDNAVALEIPDAASVAFCCLGTTMAKAGSKEAFRAVDFDAVVSFGRACQHKGVKRFFLVSSLGASAKSSNFYLKTKGEAEDALSGLGFEQLTVVRPSFLDDEGSRSEARLGERIALPVARAIFSIVGKTSRYAPVSVDVVGRALVALAFDGSAGHFRVVESDELHKLGA